MSTPKKGEWVYRVTAGPDFNQDAYSVFVYRYTQLEDESFTQQVLTSTGGWVDYKAFERVSPTIHISGLAAHCMSPENAEKLNQAVLLINSISPEYYP